MADRGEGITAMVICQDEEQRIGDCLAALEFCDELVVVDGGSKDRTLEIVRGTRARLFENPFTSWNAQKDFGRAQAGQSWVLNIDADEIVTPELRDEIQRRLAGGIDPEVAGFRMPFRTHFRGAWVRTCGYYPDRHVRLVHKERASWDQDSVHDRLLTRGRVEDLRGHIDHFSFESFDDFLAKSRTYASAFATHAHERGRRSGVASLLVRPAFRFFKAFVLQRGFLQGALGATIAGLQAYEVFQKYARLWELQRFEGGRDG